MDSDDTRRWPPAMGRGWPSWCARWGRPLRVWLGRRLRGAGMPMDPQLRPVTTGMLELSSELDFSGAVRQRRRCCDGDDAMAGDGLWAFGAA
ncbi:hypothetical protein ACP4OV_002102 [Aristida adscensionis]